METITTEMLRRRLMALSDPRRAAFSAKLIPGNRRPLLGVRIPELRSLARELAKTDLRAALAALDRPETHEEMLLRGLLIGYARLDYADFERLVREFVGLIDNWAVCDTVCCTLTAVRARRDEAWAFLLPYVRSEREYEARFGVVMLMNHFLTDDYVGRVLDELRRVRPTTYYVEMAVGWALATAYARFESLTLAVLSDERVPAASRRKACQKILESLRTTPEQRSQIRALKSTIK